MQSDPVTEITSRAAVVLVRPQSPDNIGSVARVMANMGLGRLILVRPRSWDPGRMGALATRLGRNKITEELEHCPDLGQALAGFQVVVGTTARLGRLRRPSGGPREIMGQAMELLESNRLALVFGPEKDGLTNPELELCQLLVRIPTAPGAASLNLAQAVMVLAYELRLAALERAGRSDTARRLASWEEQEGMYGHLEETLDRIDPDRHYDRRIWLHAARRLLGRTGLEPHEVRLIRGFCRKVCWAVAGSGKLPEEGRSDGEQDLLAEGSSGKRAEPGPPLAGAQKLF